MYTKLSGITTYQSPSFDNIFTRSKKGVGYFNTEIEILEQLVIVHTRVNALLNSFLVKRRSRMSIQLEQKKSKNFVHKTDFQVGVFFLLLSCFVVYKSSQMPKELPGVSFGPGIMPFYLGLIMLVFSLILIGQSFSGKNNEVTTISKSEFVGVGILFVILVIYLSIMEFIGYAIATFLLVTLLARRLGNYAYWKCALLGAATASITVYLFRTLLDMPLPIGFLGF